MRKKKTPNGDTPMIRRCQRLGACEKGVEFLQQLAEEGVTTPEQLYDALNSFDQAQFLVWYMRKTHTPVSRTALRRLQNFVKRSPEYVAPGYADLYIGIRKLFAMVPTESEAFAADVLRLLVPNPFKRKVRR